MEDPKRVIIGAANILNDYLEIKMAIPRELTYYELADEIRKRNIPEPLKTKLVEFFEKMAFEEYTDNIQHEEAGKVLSFVEKVIDELSKWTIIR